MKPIVMADEVGFDSERNRLRKNTKIKNDEYRFSKIAKYFYLNDYGNIYSYL